MKAKDKKKIAQKILEWMRGEIGRGVLNAYRDAYMYGVGVIIVGGEELGEIRVVPWRNGKRSLPRREGLAKQRDKHRGNLKDL